MLPSALLKVGGGFWGGGAERVIGGGAGVGAFFGVFFVADFNCGGG